MEQSLEPFTLTADDGTEIAAYRELPSNSAKGIVQIAHGMSEHARRYARLAGRLAGAGFAVYANDHRGHGASVGVGGLGDFGPGGFQSVVDDMAALTRLAKRELPDRPLFLLGHSMGSFAAQLYLLAHSEELSGLALSGTAALDAFLAGFPADGQPVSLEVLNRPFEPGRTGFDWLSRDEAEVDAYIADPLCGFALTDASLMSLFALGATARADPRLAHVRRRFPVYVISGENDPVVGPGQSYARALIERYEAVGIWPVEHRVYPGGRHEMFNEICREEVERDLIAWLHKAA